VRRNLKLIGIVLACPPPKTDPFAMLGIGSKTCWLGGVMGRKRFSPETIQIQNTNMNYKNWILNLVYIIGFVQFQ
jgi:hypothetical protein